MANLVRWEPFRDLVSLRDAMDRLFEESFVRPAGSLAYPSDVGALAIDIYDDGDNIMVKSALPGVQPDDVEINVTGDTLTISGETKVEDDVKDENYIRRERRYGSFCRSFTLPTPIVADKAAAEFKDGILTLSLHKAEQAKPKTITVKAK